MGGRCSDAEQLGCFCARLCRDLNRRQHRSYCPSCPLQPPNGVVSTCPAPAPLQSPRGAEDRWGTPPGHPVSPSPGGREAGDRRGLHGCLGEGTCSLERKEALRKDETNHDDTKRIRQSLKVFSSFYSSSSSKEISRINLRI